MNNNDQNENLVSGIKVSFTFLVFFRIALLVGPLTAAILNLAHAPLVCAAVCLSWLGVWLSVDVWPFRAASATTQKTASAAAGRALTSPAFFSGISKTQWWSCLFCSVIMFLTVLRSRMHI